MFVYFFLVALSASEMGFEYQGDVQFQFQHSLEESEVFSVLPEVNLELDKELNSFSVFSEFRYWHDFDGDNGLQSEFLVRELFLEIRPNYNLQLSFGRKIEIWGVSDEFSPNDYLNSEDLRYFIIRDRAERKRGTEIVEISSLVGDNTELKLLLLPFFHRSKIPIDRSPWLPAFQRALTTSGAQINNQDQPDWKYQNFQYAARALHRASSFDFGLYFFRGFESLPFYEFNGLATNSQPIYVPSYSKMTAVGFSLVYPFDDWLIKAESSYRHSVKTESSDLSLPGGKQIRDQVRSYFGVETIFPGSQWFTVEYFPSFFLSYTGDQLRNRYQHILFAQTRRPFFRDEFEVYFQWAMDFSEYGQMLNLEAAYLAVVNFRVTAGAYSFLGSQPDIFAQYTNNDFAYIRLKYSF